MSEERPPRPDDPQQLRRRAEEAAAARAEDQDFPPLERLPELVHELRVHQVELEMQNAALREMHTELEASRDRYADLYDFSPVGYVTVDEEGRICEINLTACNILGRERSRLLGHPLVSFVNNGGKNRFLAHLRHCRGLERGQEVCLEATLRNAEEQTETPVQMRTLAVDDPTGPRWRMAVMDIRDRTRAEGQLREINERLEDEVRERTSALQMLRDIASMANRARDVEEALEFCLRRVAEHNGWSFGHAYLSSADDPDLLLPAYSWYGDDAARFAAFRELTLKTPLRRGECLPGRVYEKGKPEWTTEIQGEVGARRIELAESLGIGTISAFPVMAEQRVVAVLEFFCEKKIEPRPSVLESMASIGLQLGRVIERKAFQDRLLTLAEDEHRRIGQDLHDDVGQELTGLALKVETLADLLGDEGTPAGELARRLVEVVGRIRRKTQALSRGLVPMEVGAAGIEAALEELALQVDQGRDVSCRFHHEPGGRVTDARAATQLYHIAQEAVANVLRHSRAEQVVIALTSDEGDTVLEVRDDGQGLPQGIAPRSGMGLQIMHYRAGLIGGKLTIDSPADGGTRVVCRLPGGTQAAAE